MSITKLERAEPRSYGEIKKPKQFMITDSASAELDKVAEELGISRSEVLEWIIRGGGTEAAKRYKAAQETIAS